MDYHPAARAEERGEGICRTCLLPIWYDIDVRNNEVRTRGWSDRQRVDAFICFSADHYEHVPLKGREAAIWDHAWEKGRESRD